MGNIRLRRGHVNRSPCRRGVCHAGMYTVSNWMQALPYIREECQEAPGIPSMDANLVQDGHLSNFAMMPLSQSCAGLPENANCIHLGAPSARARRCAAQRSHLNSSLPNMSTCHDVVIPVRGYSLS